MKTTRTRAIVLRRTNYGEADRILQLLTPTGRIAVMARGVRREKSKLAGGIELFAISDIVVGQGKGQLQVLTSSRLVQFYRHILEDYDRLQFAYEMIAQISKASESLDEPEWYDIATEILMGLDNKTVPLQLTQMWFYLHMSAMLGDQLNIDRDYKGEKLSAGTTYRYDSHEKGLVAASNGEITTDHIKVLRLAATRSLQVIMQVGGIGQFLPECLYVARQHASL
ncbi:DNA repair protein RecO [Candidatus Saccharibacteria bacterium RIFCSPHIGHO2_01_FULL_45_15]|nr:MAG: DNA repair protein RecO [Candidatus Saccharibacteria bacterium RIFCSPHIGHO2_01_FULL_45_15]OGL28970.1 MAG: DNA repair protein RecO [Candidatus Saccharibacteria bacterium RIFCSPHIGHO2_02_FULL_46_12]OGL31984.1 MAG: DNA repair protein RecO [Candidatus Saccharibacteria bacterium RIFCSPHIGHO2_12_FULL_44_22]